MMCDIFHEFTGPFEKALGTALQNLAYFPMYFYNLIFHFPTVGDDTTIQKRSDRLVNDG